MPKDCPPVSHAPTALDFDPSKGPGPLKRGDACLYCRKRRIRCSANKPSCDNCTKLNRECVYDTGKPVSRVKQLEDKVAELQDMLRGGLPAANTAGAGTGTGEGDRGARGSIGCDEAYSRQGSVSHPPLTHHASSGQSFSSDNTTNGAGQSTAYSLGPGTTYDASLNMNGLNSSSNNSGFDMTAFSAFGGSVFPSIPIALPGQTNAPSAVEQTFDFSTLDPGFMNLVNSFGAISNDAAPEDYSWQQIQKQTEQPNLIPPAAQFGSTGLTPFLETSPSAPSQQSSNSAQQSPGSFFPSMSSAPSTESRSVNYQAYVVDMAESSGGPSRNGSTSTGAGGLDGTSEVYAGVPGRKRKVQINKYFADGRLDTDNCGGPVEDSTAWMPDQPEMGVMGGWFDASDVPKVARDHLLDLFFSGMRMVGQSYHVPRFMARSAASHLCRVATADKLSLSLPPARRPHPCLLYAMYLTASRISTSPAIRALEPHFHTIAARQLDESIALADRLFDAVRAGTILSIYYFSLARYHQGFMTTGTTARLALSCGLNQIPSSVFRPSTISNDKRADLVAIMRQRSYVLPPPVDPVELGERIWAFWTVYTLDRCGSIASQWPPAIPDDIIITPYPKPLSDYELVSWVSVTRMS